MADTIRIEQPNVLIVEGEEDKRFFEALVNDMGLTNLQIMPIGGKTKLRENLKALVASPGFSGVISLCVVRDANSDPHAVFQSVCDALKNAGLPLPEKPLEVVDKRPSVAIIILPEAGSPGTLEDLCLKAVADDPAIPCVEEYFECLKEHKVPLPNNMSKAKVQVFLASKPRADLRLGEAAKAGYWPLDHEAFQTVREFIARLVREV